MCNYSRDNVQATLALAREIIDILKSAKVESHVMYSADRRHHEFVDSGIGFFVDRPSSLAVERSPFQRVEIFENPSFGRGLKIDRCVIPWSCLRCAGRPC